MILLQTQALNANDIMFRVTDVIFIVSGVITLLTAWFAFKSAQSKTDDRITFEVARGDEKRAAIMEKHKALEGRIMSVENSMDTIEKDLGKKIEAFGKDVQDLKIAIVTTKNEILQALLKRK